MLPAEFVEIPPNNDDEARELIFYRLVEAIEELQRQNGEKADRVKRCEYWFLRGLGLVSVALTVYLFFSYPPFKG